MNDNRKYYTLERIVRGICDMRGDSEAANYSSVARQAVFVLDQLNLYLFPNVKSDFLTVEDNLTIPLDDSWIDVTKIGIVQNGCLIVLPYDPDLIHSAHIESKNKTYFKCDCDNTGQLPASTTTVGCSKCTFYNVSIVGHSHGEAYGRTTSAKEYGSWRWDGNSNTIVFGSGVYLKAGTKVLVERKPALSVSELQLIPAVYYPVIMQRVNQWMDQVSQPGSSQLAFDQFLREYEQLKSRHFEDWNLEDYYDMLRSNFSPAPRYQ